MNLHLPFPQKNLERMMRGPGSLKTGHSLIALVQTKQKQSAPLDAIDTYTCLTLNPCDTCAPGTAQQEAGRIKPKRINIQQFCRQQGEAGSGIRRCSETSPPLSSLPCQRASHPKGPPIPKGLLLAPLFVALGFRRVAVHGPCRDDQGSITSTGAPGRKNKPCNIAEVTGCLILYYTILYFIILYYIIFYSIILYSITVYYILLYYTLLYSTILYYTILYYTILYYTILYYTIL